MTDRAPALQAFISQFKTAVGISDAFANACDHPFTCRCAACLEWWATMGADENDIYGPFTKTEIEAYLTLDKSTAPMIY